jgi:hypothetical protein
MILCAKCLTITRSNQYQCNYNWILPSYKLIISSCITNGSPILESHSFLENVLDAIADIKTVDCFNHLFDYKTFISLAMLSKDQTVMSRTLLQHIGFKKPADDKYKDLALNKALKQAIEDAVCAYQDKSDAQDVDTSKEEKSCDMVSGGSKFFPKNIQAAEAFNEVIASLLKRAQDIENATKLIPDIAKIISLYENSPENSPTASVNSASANTSGVSSRSQSSQGKDY